MIGLNHTRIQIQLCNSQNETSALWQPLKQGYKLKAFE